MQKLNRLAHFAVITLLLIAFFGFHAANAQDAPSEEFIGEGLIFPEELAPPDDPNQIIQIETFGEELQIVSESFGVTPEDVAALQAIFDKMTPVGQLQSGWFAENRDACTWWGITCENGTVIGLNFDNVDFFCGIPAAIASLPAVREVHLTNTLIYGIIPDELFVKDTLTVIDLSNNLLTGPIPSSLYLPRLEILKLANNKLTEDKQRNLNERPTLSGCQAASNYPPERNIDLTPGLDGEIPMSFGTLNQLRHLDLSGNNLGGRLPDELIFQYMLQTIYLNDNRGEDGFWTDFPDLIAKLESIPDRNLTGVNLIQEPTEEPTLEIPTEEPPTPEPLPTDTEIPTPEPLPTDTEVPTPEPLPTDTPVPTPEPLPTDTEVPTPEPLPTDTEVPTPEPLPTDTEVPTPEPLPTDTEVPTPEPLPTDTEVPTPEPLPTDTPVPPIVPPLSTNTPLPLPTDTSVPPTATPVPTNTAVPPTTPPIFVTATSIPSTAVPPTALPIVIHWVTATSQQSFNWVTATPFRQWMTATPGWSYMTATPMPYIPPSWTYPTAAPQYIYPTAAPSYGQPQQQQPTYYYPQARTTAPASNWTPFAQVATATKAPTVNPASLFDFKYDATQMTAEKLPVSWKYTGMDSYMINYLTRNRTLFPGFAMEWMTADKLCSGESCSFEIMNIPSDLLKDGVFYIQLQGRDKSGRVYQSDPIGLQAAVTPEPSATPVVEEVKQGNWFTRFFRWLFGPIIRLFGGE